MPFPFLIGAGVLLSGLAAAGGYLSAKEKNENAKKLYNTAKSTYDDKVQVYNEVYQQFNALTNEAVLNKAHLLKQTIPEFKKYFNRIKNLDEVKKYAIARSDFKIQDLEDLSKYQQSVEQVVEQANSSLSKQNDDNDASVSLGAMLGPGAVAGYGAVTGLMAGGVGGAISGAAAAALTSPLAIIAAPVFLVSAFKADSKADENLAEAKSYALKIEAECKAINLKTARFKAIGQNAKIYGSLLLDLEAYFVPMIKKMGAVIDLKLPKKSIFAQLVGIFKGGNDNKRKPVQEIFTRDELELIGSNLAMFKALKDLVDAPLYDNNFELDPKLGAILTKVNNAVNKGAATLGKQRSESVGAPVSTNDFLNHDDETFITDMIADFERKNKK